MNDPQAPAVLIAGAALLAVLWAVLFFRGTFICPALPRKTHGRFAGRRGLGVYSGLDFPRGRRSHDAGVIVERADQRVCIQEWQGGLDKLGLPSDQADFGHQPSCSALDAADLLGRDVRSVCAEPSRFVPHVQGDLFHPVIEDPPRRASHRTHTVRPRNSGGTE